MQAIFRYLSHGDFLKSILKTHWQQQS